MLNWLKKKLAPPPAPAGDFAHTMESCNGSGELVCNDCGHHAIAGHSVGEIGLAGAAAGLFPGWRDFQRPQCGIQQRSFGIGPGRRAADFHGAQRGLGAAGGLSAAAGRLVVAGMVVPAALCNRGRVRCLGRCLDAAVALSPALHSVGA